MNIVTVVVVLGLWSGVGAAPQVPCYFIFGDSLVDNGNNNRLSSLAKANYLPYGIDFPGGPTGRFSNGKTTVDVIGNNDCMNNYFMPHHYPTSRTYGPERYAEALIQQYSLHIRALYQTGARKIALIGLGLIGCTPHEISTHGKNGSSTCVEEESKAVLIFNVKLKSLVDQFNKELSDAKCSDHIQ